MFDQSKNPVINYFHDSYEELKKVTWPTRNHAIRLTLIVIGFCVAVSILIGVLDNGFNYGYRSLVIYADKVAPAKSASPVKVNNIQAVTETQQTNTTSTPVK